MCLAFGRAYGVPAVAFRMFNVYGARQALSNPYTGVVAIFCSRLLQNQPPIVFEDGEQRRDFVHVEDVARAYVLGPGERWRATAWPSTSAADRASASTKSPGRLAAAMGKSCRTEIPGKYRDGDIRHCFADIGLIKSNSAGRRSMNSIRESASSSRWVLSQTDVKTIGDSYAELKALGLLK